MSLKRLILFCILVLGIITSVIFMGYTLAAEASADPGNSILVDKWHGEEYAVYKDYFAQEDGFYEALVFWAGSNGTEYEMQDYYFTYTKKDGQWYFKTEGNLDDDTSYIPENDLEKVRTFPIADAEGGQWHPVKGNKMANNVLFIIFKHYGIK